MARRELTVADVVQGAIAQAEARLVAHEQELRETDDAEAVHQARVATRRLRSDLRTFEPWIDEEWAEELRAEMRWLGAELGAVRDLDVMRDRLREHAAQLPASEAEAAERVIRRLDADRAAARAELLTALRDARYEHLRRSLESAARDPRLRKKSSKRAAQLAAAVRKRRRQLDRAVKKLGTHPADEQLHDVRVRAKRARYAAEACVVAFGKPARRYAKAMAGVQDVLGEHHDAVVAAAWLTKTAPECTPVEAYAIGMLAQLERNAADAARTEFSEMWPRASRKKLRAWM